MDGLYGSERSSDYRRPSLDIFQNGQSPFKKAGSTSRTLASLTTPSNPYNQFSGGEGDEDYLHALSSAAPSGVGNSSLPGSSGTNGSIPEEDNLYFGIPAFNSSNARSNQLPELTPQSRWGRDDLMADNRGSEWYTGGSSSQRPRLVTDEDEIRWQFNDYLDAMSPIRAEEKEAYLATSLAEKQQMLDNQRQRSPVFKVKYYIDNLRPHRGSSGRKSRAKLEKTISATLRHLKLDLLMSDQSFVIEFINWRYGPNGMTVLLNLLMDIKTEQRNLVRSPNNDRVFKRLLYDEYDCLLCIQFAMRVPNVCEKFVDYKTSITLITECLRAKFIKSATSALNILTAICKSSQNGYYNVMDAMSDLRMRHKESVHFYCVSVLVQTHTEAPMQATHMPYLIAAMRFFNTIVSQAESSNTRVYIQHEVSLGGVNEDKLSKKADGTAGYQTDLAYELHRWKEQFIDVSYVTKLGKEVSSEWNRARILRQEVDRLQDQIESLQNDFIMVEREKVDQLEKNDGLKDMVLRLQDTVEKLNSLYINTTGVAPTQEQIDLQIARQPLDVAPQSLMFHQPGRRLYKPTKRPVYEYEANYPQSDNSVSTDSGHVTGRHGRGRGGGKGAGKRKKKHRKKHRKGKSGGKRGAGGGAMSVSDSESSSSSSDAEEQDDPGKLFSALTSPAKKKPAIPAAPAPPAAPVMAPPPGVQQSNILPKVPLPFLNWTPMYNTTNTVFDGMDQEAMIKKIDFSEFEEEFKLPNRDRGQNMQEVQNKHKRQREEKILFVELNRAKNLIITKKKLKLTPQETAQAIEKCNCRTLPGEYAKILLAYVPTEEEMQNIEEHKDRYSKMGEAEQFMCQLSKVNRLEQKLNLMAFIGLFEDYNSSLKPQMESILWSSTSVLESEKFKKILEIVLAFGNYMNSHKRGITKGFKLDSLIKLLDVKSTDRKMTLMHFLVNLVEKDYPDLLDFFDELDIHVERGVSYQAIHSDMDLLRKGLDLVRHEKIQQPNNEDLLNFYNSSHTVVMSMGDLFREMDESYKGACEFFGEKHKKMEPDEFFAMIKTFITNFRKALDENHMRSKGEIQITGPKPETLDLLQNRPQPTEPEAMNVKLKPVDEQGKVQRRVKPGLTPIEQRPETVHERVQEIETLVQDDEPLPLMRPTRPKIWGASEPAEPWLPSREPGAANMYANEEDNLSDLYARPSRPPRSPSPTSTLNEEKALETLELALMGEDDVSSIAPSIPERTPSFMESVTSEKSAKVQDLLDEVNRRKSRFEPERVQRRKTPAPGRRKTPAPPPPVKDEDDEDCQSISDMSYENEGPFRARPPYNDYDEEDLGEESDETIEGPRKLPGVERRTTPFPGQYNVDDEDDDDDDDDSYDPTYDRPGAVDDSDDSDDENESQYQFNPDTDDNATSIADSTDVPHSDTESEQSMYASQGPFKVNQSQPPPQKEPKPKAKPQAPQPPVPTTSTAPLNDGDGSPDKPKARKHTPYANAPLNDVGDDEDDRPKARKHTPYVKQPVRGDDDFDSADEYEDDVDDDDESTLGDDDDDDDDDTAL